MARLYPLLTAAAALITNSWLAQAQTSTALTTTMYLFNMTKTNEVYGNIQTVNARSETVIRLDCSNLGKDNPECEFFGFATVTVKSGMPWPLVVGGTSSLLGTHVTDGQTTYRTYDG
ncbi:hypothetical protein B0H66DRAFT_555708 [Apodospora peruviana]|uniref:Uncharacterized protein n=1 Tax=Apodospora peruviana TaxID=516989 RepID=A0AAE0M9M7_9PEZI|nr:hypothetical protein B0H66DRAFT_555708 [Apodospora peruviana]